MKMSRNEFQIYRHDSQNSSNTKTTLKQFLVFFRNKQTLLSNVHKFVVTFDKSLNFGKLNLILFQMFKKA